MTNREEPKSRTDLHCHSTASQVSKLGVQRALGLPECATPPEEVYLLAKRRGMDFVTITDHDTIAGAQEIAARYDDAFISEELTAWFPGERRAVHILCLGITPDDHAWLQAHAHDVELVATYLREQEITCSLAHPFFAVEAPLLARHRRRLAQLFDVWETRNGARAPELNQPASLYVETHGGAATGGSDDHAGIDIGRTWTQTPPARDWREFLDHVRHGHTEAAGAQGSSAKWAHAAMAIGVRSLGHNLERTPPDPARVLRMVERVMAEGDARRGAMGADLSPADARALLDSWLGAIELDLPRGDLIAYLQAEGFSHSDLFRRARRCHERKLARATETLAVDKLFDACVAVIPYAPAAAFLGREKARLSARDRDRPRVALVVDGLSGLHDLQRLVTEVREQGVPGYEVEVIGTDHCVDRRLASVAEADVAGTSVGVPGLPAVVAAIGEGGYDLVHFATPGPAGAAAALIARMMELPLVGTFHPEVPNYGAARLAMQALYRPCAQVLSPSPSGDVALLRLGLRHELIRRWERFSSLDRLAYCYRRAFGLDGREQWTRGAA